MDQVKAALGWLKTYHFWVLTVLVALIGVTCWWLAKGSMAEDIASGMSQIGGEFSAVSRLGSQRLHPNKRVNDKQAQEIVKLADKVRQQWSVLYDRQRNEALVWPEALSERFRGYVDDRSFGDTIISDFRGEYLNYIKDSFSSLPAIVDAKEIEDRRGGRIGAGRGGRGGGEFGLGEGPTRGFGGVGRGGDEEFIDDGHMVRWHDQLAVKEQLTWDETPSSSRIWVTQEDLWVYQTLLRAIAATNKAAGSDRYTNAAVRDIHAMEVGKPAAAGGAGAESRIYMPAADAAGMGGRGMEVGRGEFGSGGRMPPEGGGEMGGRAQYDMIGGGRGGRTGALDGEGSDPDAALVAFRYVDETGAPIPEALDGEFKFGTEFKRLPVRLVLTLDQRWLPRLIAELANQPLQVEVKEVRIDPAGGVAAGGGAMRGLGRGGGRSLGGVSRGGAFGGVRGEVLAFDREPQVREAVEISGVVYIFYPPDESVLQVEGAGGQGALAGF